MKPQLGLRPRSIEEWLHLIPYEPVRQQAWDNFIKQKYNNSVVNRLDEAINKGFVWNQTPEGFQYWGNIYIRILNMYDSIKIKSQEPPTMGMAY